MRFIHRNKSNTKIFLICFLICTIIGSFTGGSFAAANDNKVEFCFYSEDFVQHTDNADFVTLENQDNEETISPIQIQDDDNKELDIPVLSICYYLNKTFKWI